MKNSIENPLPHGIPTLVGESFRGPGTSSTPRGLSARFLHLFSCLLLFWLSAPLARAQGVPPGCTGSAIGISLFTSAPDVHIGDTLTYGVSVFNGLPGNPTSCDASNIVASLITPDGVVHPITLVRTYLMHAQSDFYPNVVSYVVRAEDVLPDGSVRATAKTTAVIYQNDTPSNGGANQGVNTEVSLPCVQILAQCIGAVGENGAITFSGTVTNCGNNTLIGMTLTNFVNGGQFPVTLSTNRIGRGQSATFSGAYIPLDPCNPSTATLVVRATDQTTFPRVVTSSANTTCGQVVTPGIKITKTCPPQPVAPGQLLVFSGSVSNTGNVTLTNIVVVHDQPSANTLILTVASLAPGAVTNFTGTFVAPTNCFVTGALTATAASRCGVPVRDTATATCAILTTPRIAVTVLCPVIPAAIGGTLIYSGNVRNTGDTVLTNIVVVSDRPAPNTPVFTIGSLLPGAAADFSTSLIAPGGACSITTVFSGRAQDICSATLVTNAVSRTCPITTAPAIAVTLACPTSPVAPGAMITYAGTVRNSGNVALSNVTVTNSQAVPSTVFAVASLLPGAVSNFTVSFTSPLDACAISTAVTAAGSDQCTGAPVSNTAAATCTLVATPRLVVTQSCPVSPAGLEGVLTYSGSVSNAGNITVTNVVLTNDRSGAAIVFAVATLAPGAVTNFTGSFTVPLNAGCAIASTLTANGRDKCTGSLITASATATCPVQGSASIDVILACPPTPTALGAVLAFSGTVRNSGNITLTNVVVTRNSPRPEAAVFTIASLAPGDSRTFSGSYIATAFNACSTTTSVSATANEQCAGSTVIDRASIDCPLVATPAIQVSQTCPATAGLPGGLMVYNGFVTNTGNVTLTNVVVVSSQPAPNTVILVIAALAPGAGTNFTRSLNAPLDACAASSTLNVSGQNQCNGAAVSNSVTTTCVLLTAPRIAVTKSCPITPVVEGGLLVFTGTVTNTGNITLTNIFVVNNRPSASTALIGPLTLAPGAGTNFTGSYLAPLNACSVTDTVTATGQDKCSGSTVTNSVSATCPIATVPRIAVTLECPVAQSAPGGLVTYTGTVRNIGNVTLNNVTVTNSQALPNVVLTLASLAPGASAPFAASFSSPIDACAVSSTVTAGGSDACSQARVTATASATCVLLTNPRIVVTQLCPTSPASPGGILTYSGSVSNAGNITLTNVVVTGGPGATNVFSIATLAPGAVANFTGSYRVPLDSGCLTSSSVTASGFDKCTGVRVVASASATCPLLTTPRITVTQTCPTIQSIPGGMLTYSGTVSNSGNVSLTNVVVVNNHPASNTVIYTVAFLAPGASTNFTGSYQVPLNCCVVSSTVGATGRDICNGVTVADTFTATCTVLTTPKIVVTKICPATELRTGDLLQYSGTVSNAGNITLVNVTIVNSQSPAGSPVWGPLTLAPGESARYSASYVTPADFCGTDTVTAQGLDACTFAPVVNSVTTTCPVITAPRIAVTKNCPVNPTVRGGLYTFTGSVSNPGNVTLVNVFVTDNQPSNNTPVIGPITLAPGATVNFSGSYIAPACCCYLVDTLTARGQDRCSGSNVIATATSLCPLDSSPRITVSKVCPPANVPVGGLFTYAGVVRNAGDVVLTNVFVVGSQPNANTPLLGPIELAPGESKTFSGSYTVTAASNPTTDTVSAHGMDTCQGRTVTAAANCFGPLGQTQIVATVSQTNSIATITWTSTAGVTYTLQSKTNLFDGSWFNIPGTVTATGSSASKTDVLGTNRFRFYQIQVAP